MSKALNTINKYFVYIILSFWVSISVANDCKEPAWAKNLNCTSVFRSYSDILKSYSQAIADLDDLELAKLGKKLDLTNDKAIKCISISKDHKEYSILSDVLVAKGSLFSSIEAYLRFKAKAPNSMGLIEDRIKSDYTDLIHAVTEFNKKQQRDGLDGRRCTGR